MFDAIIISEVLRNFLVNEPLVSGLVYLLHLDEILLNLVWDKNYRFFVCTVLSIKVIEQPAYSLKKPLRGVQTPLAQFLEILMLFKALKG